MMKYLDFEHIVFAHPQFFLLLLLLPIMIYWHYRYLRARQGSYLLSTLKGYQAGPASFRIGIRKILPWLRILAFVFLVVALARPQNTKVNETVNSEGIDIILSLDISGSMLAEDFSPNRMEAAKTTASNFVANRPTDRIGLVIFAGESFTQCPLTTDQNVLQQQIRNIKNGLLQDGTAIGMGLATAVERLRSSKASSRIIILMTDGVNNSGLIDPVTALEIAKAYKVRVYTIGVGTTGTALSPVPDASGRLVMKHVPVQIDEVLLQKIARETGGKYFRATGNRSLEQVYQEIDKLEKTKIEINSFTRYGELFFFYACIGLGLIFLELLLRYTLVRTLND